MSKLWEHSFWYSALRPYVDFCTRTSYYRVKVSGRENLPSDGAILLAPNHSNALMDALIVLQADKGSTGFGARADIFKNPAANAALRFMRIVPIARKRDGTDALLSGSQVYDEVVEALAHDVPFCLFAEGTHRGKHSLLPLRKGLFRLALKAYAELGREVYIVPVGIDYSTYTDYMGSCSMQYGKPIRVSEYLTSTEEQTEAQIMRRMASDTYDAIARLITYFPDDNYEALCAEWQASRRPSGLKRALLALAAVLLTPLFVASAAISFPVWLPAEALAATRKDHTWNNTMRFVVRLLWRPIATLAVLVTGLCMPLGWLALSAAAVFWLAGDLFYLILRLYKLLLQ